MAKGSYIGGHTIISPHSNPDWFGSSQPCQVDQPLPATAVLEDAQKRLAEIEANRPDKPSRNYRKKLAAARDAVRVARQKPGAPTRRTPLDAKGEAEIANLVRQIKAHRNAANSAASEHQRLQTKLQGLLPKHGIDPTVYPDATMKLKI